MNSVTRHRRRRGRTRWPPFLAAVVALILLAPVGWAVATPRLSEIAAVPPEAALLPMLPRPLPHVRRTLDGLVEDLPLVARDLPDPSSRRAMRDYDRATLLEPRLAATMFLDAWHGLVIPPHEARLVGRLADALLGASTGVGAPPLRLPTTALGALVTDPRNADRLNNMAVALAALAIANENGVRVTTLLGRSLGLPNALRSAAVALLRETDRAFAPNRAVRLNLAFLANPGLTVDAAAVAPLARLVHDHPADRTARFLLGSLQSRQTDPGAIDRAATTLRPLASDATTAPLGDAALGDADLTAALLRQSTAPGLARLFARQALDHYDRALRTTTDAGIYAGRSAALAFLGAAVDAVVAQQRAAALEPTSIDLLLGLAARHEEAGDLAGMQASAQAALALSLRRWNPPLRRLRIVPDPTAPDPNGPDPNAPDPPVGYLAFSYGSDRDHMAAFAYATAGAGGYILLDDLIPGPPDATADLRQLNDFTPDVAILRVLSADVLLADPRRARAAAALWEQGRRADKNLAGPPAFVAQHIQDVTARPLAAAALTAGQPLSAGADLVQTLSLAQATLRAGGRFSAAATLCRRVARQARLAAIDRVTVLRWAGESSYLAHDIATAATTLAAADRLAHTTGDDDHLLTMEAAVAAQAAGDTPSARRLFVAAATAAPSLQNSQPVALAKLADLDLDTAERSGGAPTYRRALAEYGRALAAIGDTGPGHSAVGPEVATLDQYARNNRGIALLRLAQPNRSKAPDCAAERDLCRQANADFAVAHAADPGNAVYLLNAGWVARLLGDTRAARRWLSAAVEIDPSLFPALNDLGVLAVEEGDEVAAHDFFARALAANPGYDLAAWNLGVLEMARGPAGVIPGEAWLARASTRNGALRGAEPAYRFDERVYRVALSTHRGAADWEFGRAYSIAAVTLGSLTLFLVVWQVARELAGDKLNDTLSELAERQGPRLLVGARRLVAARGHRLSPATARSTGDEQRQEQAGGEHHVVARARWWWPWLLTLPILLAITAWLAAQSTPETVAGTMTVAVFATLVAVAAHELGHALTARWLGARVLPTHWVPGAVLALLLAPVHLSSGPYVGHRVRASTARRAWWVCLGGPLANLIVAAVAYALFVLQPLPVLRVVVEAQLAVIGYALLPIEPLDGHVLARRTRVLTVLSLVVTVTGIVLALGIL